MNRSIALVSANGGQIPGGTSKVTGVLCTKSYPLHGGPPVTLEFETTLLEAEVPVDMILSFKWLVDFDLDVRPRLNGLQTNPPHHYFIPGCGDSQSPPENEVPAFTL